MVSGGSIAGIVIGCLIAVAAVVVVLIIIWKQRPPRSTSTDRAAKPGSIRALSFRFTREHRNRTESGTSTSSGPTYYAKSSCDSAHSDVVTGTSTDGKRPESGYAYVTASGRPAVPFAQTPAAGEHPYEMSETFPPVKLMGASQLSAVTLNSEDHQATAATYTSMSRTSPLGSSPTSPDASDMHVRTHAQIHGGHGAAAAAEGSERKLSIPEPGMYEQPVVRRTSKDVRCSDGDPAHEYDEAVIVGASDKSASHRGYDDPTSLRELAATESGVSLFRDNAANSSNDSNFEQHAYDDPSLKKSSRPGASGLKPVADYLMPADQASATHA